MAAYLVTYDLNKPGQHHAAVLEEIKKSPGWAKLSESSYAISTTETASQLLARVRRHADPNDTIYVISLRKPWDGYGPKNVNEWLNNSLPSA